MTQEIQSLLDELNNLDKEREKVGESLELIKTRAREEDRHNQAIIDSLNERLAEVKRYNRMNPFQRFWYRLFHRPGWL